LFARCGAGYGRTTPWKIVGSLQRPLLFIMYTIDPLGINSISEPVLFAGDASVRISSINFGDSCSLSDLVLSYD
jgi:hypothetical protein